MSISLITIIPLAAMAIIAIAVFAFVCRFFLKDRKTGNAVIALFAVFSLIAAFASGTCAQKIPALKESVRITALNEKNENSAGVEIILREIVADGTEYEIPTPVEGKWFFTGSGYMWRPAGDSRQPEGTTDSIVLKIPVGYERELIFNRGNWSGKVAADIYGERTVLDTNVSAELALKHSTKWTYGLNFVYKMLCFTVIMSALCGLFLLYYNAVYRKRVKKETAAKLVYGGIALTAFLIMVYYSKDHTFWIDEMYQVAFSGTGKTLYETLMVTETSPPLFRLVANLWYRIAPYGEEWLLLLPEAACAVTVYVSGLLGERLSGRAAGVLSGVFLATASVVYVNAAYEFRPYGFLMMFSALFCYAYLVRLEKGRNAKLRHQIAVFLSMLCLSYTHLFGFFLCALVFVLDFFLLFFKKNRFIDLIPFFLTLLLFIPWVRLAFGFSSDLMVIWMTPPTYRSIYELFVFLCSDRKLAQILFVIGASMLLARFAAKLNAGTFDTDAVKAAFPLFCLLMYPLCLFLYGAVVNREASLWANRYFVLLLPLTAAVIGSSVTILQKIPSLVQNGAVKKGTAVSLAVLSICLFAVNFQTVSAQPTTKNHPDKQIFEEAADWLYDQSTTVFSASTLVIYDDWDRDYLADAWYEYYLTRQGKRDDLNYIDSYTLDELTGGDPEKYDEYFSKYDTIYLCYISRAAFGNYTQNLERSFTMVSQNTQYGVRVYQKTAENTGE